MGVVQLAEGELHYQLDGPGDAPVLVLSNSLGTDLHMWEAQMPAFSEHFQVLRFDTRGHGQSLVTPGPYSIEQLGRDVLALLDALHIERAHFCGLSMGGLIGQWLAINAGQRLHKLIVCNTAAKIGDPSAWNPRIETVLRDGAAAMAALRDASIARWFTPDFAVTNPAAVQQITDMLAATSPEGYAANCAAVRDADFRDQLSAIKLPLLVIGGSEDAVTPPSGGHFIQEQVRGAEYAEFYAAHLSNVQAGHAFSERVLTFLLADSRL
ncbi:MULTISPECIES: 3-oxoadipate enol-lactonase [unclassified Pseudomonas]|uniref:3-oxoadipate enol-lactonase n=1 Tax=unclassified Pseudomonas TaxID=196821 RepID=UPI002AC8F090|nr:MULTISPECIES: 3-oxoadipate enol-lactonase [unclassified Pseudomonas]MEB0045850.1 3-oxoadipate enol-lactonase [Pseudomonas sp. Dout3]MEB0096662.1 3-oxoadipate enol-lactonase [Pseudomonas sp. DC1.2]WPX60217.1 3-oxoadipate enol-lactonase [Pseudomonas sp. DC1.2]